MDKLKYIRVQQQGGTYSSDIPIAADAYNISMLNGHDLQETLGDLNVTNAEDVTTQLSSLHSSVNALDQQKVNHSDLSNYIDNEIADDVASWLNTNVSPTGSTVSIDKSLKVANSAADAKTVGDSLYNVNAEYIPHNQNLNTTYNGTKGQRWTHYGDTLTVTKISGTPTGFLTYNFIVIDDINTTNIIPGKSILHFQNNSSDNNYFYIELFVKTLTNSSWHTLNISTARVSSWAWLVPNDVTSILLRACYSTTKTLTTETMTPKISINTPNLKIAQDEIIKSSQSFLPNNTNLNDIKENSVYLCLSGNNGYQNYPVDTVYSGLLITFVTGRLATQIFIVQTTLQTNANGTPLIYLRYLNYISGVSNNWTNWVKYLHKEDQHLNIKQQVLTGCDLNTIFNKNISYLLADSQTYTNCPIVVGFLFNFYYVGSWNLQIAIQLNSHQIYIRRAPNQNSWTNWKKISSGGTTTNEYTFNEYQNTYNITATPSITTDTNAYLASTNDTTDRTAAILAVLNSNKICRLGKGIYYVNNLQMPSGTSIIGSGSQTHIVLSDTSDGFAIEMRHHCLVQNLLISGKQDADITISSSVRNRHGILWQGNYTAVQNDGATNQCPLRSIISNVWIRRFTGGGITCYDTGYDTANCLQVTNAYIWNCDAGINISYWSEFHKFTNIRSIYCYYGCVNNGGNNVFVNCDFSVNTVGLLMDNSQGQSPNNTHGSCIGCVFNHSNNNNGTGIKILNTHNGFIFTGCQIFFSKIEIDNTKGIVFNACNFGQNNCNIILTGNDTKSILFSNNMFQNGASVSNPNASSLIFVNNYNRTTGELITL